MKNKINAYFLKQKYIKKDKATDIGYSLSESGIRTLAELDDLIHGENPCFGTNDVKMFYELNDYATQEQYDKAMRLSHGSNEE